MKMNKLFKIIVFILMFFCLAECIAGFYLLFTYPKIPKIAMIIVIILFAIGFVYLYKFSKRKGYINKKEVLHRQSEPIEEINEEKISLEELNEGLEKSLEIKTSNDFPQDKEYLNTVLDDDKTIKEHIEEDLQNIKKEYFVNDKKEKVSIVNSKYNEKFKFNKNEELFFEEVERKSKHRLHFDRLSNGTFNVRSDDYIFLGKVHLRGKNCYATYFIEDKDEIYEVEGEITEIIICIKKWNDYIEF